MPYPSQDKQLRLDLKLLSKFIYELNIARHHSATYPAGHPVIAQSICRSLDYLNQLKPENGLISLGISKTKLAIDRSFLDEKNPVFREFAGHLFAHGIAVVTFKPNLGEQQLGKFLSILGQSKEAVEKRGGLLLEMKQQGIAGVSIQLIDYTAFGISDQIDGKPQNRTALKKKEAAIWEQFVQQLLTGDSRGSSSGPFAPQQLTPQAVAAQLNDQEGSGEFQLEGQYDQAITEFLRELDREQMAESGNSAALSRLKDLAAQLNPELRAQLLNSTFQTLATDEGMAEQVLAQFPGTLLLEVLETLNARQATIPPIIFTLLDRLKRCEMNSSSSVASSIAPRPDQESPSSALEPLLSPLYEQDQSANFIPGDYSQTLCQIEAPVRQESSAPDDVHFWRSSFSQQPLESKISDIVFELAQGEAVQGTSVHFQETLQNLCNLFLDSGDFASLSVVYKRLTARPDPQRATAPDWFPEFRHELEAGPFIDRILDALQAWGKNAFDEVAKLLNTIGPATIVPLLNRLAVEQNRALRQFYMNCLSEQGSAMQKEIVKRLGDQRWFYLRNLVILLRQTGDRSSIAEIEPLWHHPNEKVRYEVLKTALHFQDPKGQQQLLGELNQSNPQRRLAAIKMARYSREPAVGSLLASIFSDQSLAGEGLKLKMAALDSLLEQGYTELLPLLEKQFRAFSLCHPRRQMRLRQHILKSLRHFPFQDIAPLLTRLASTKNSKLARMARNAHAELFKASS